MELKTTTLREIANQMKEEGRIDKIFFLYQFLNEKPIATNYLLSREPMDVGRRSVIVKHLDCQHGPSSVPFHEHIHIQNLTPECKVTLSPKQIKMIEAVLV